MTGSNSSVHGHQHVEDDLPKTHATLGDMIEESIVAAMRRMFGGRLPIAGNGDQHQHSPAASLAADNRQCQEHNDHHVGRGRAAGAAAHGAPTVGAERRRGDFVAPREDGLHGGEARG